MTVYQAQPDYRAAAATLCAVTLFFLAAQAAAQPYPGSTVVPDITFNSATHESAATGSDNFPVTWADDDNQYTSWGDGNGFEGSTRGSLGVSRIQGSKSSYSGTDLFQSGDSSGNGPPGDGKSYGIISIQGDLYMWVSPNSGTVGYRYTKVWKSTNKGTSWIDPGWQFDGRDAFGGGNHAFINPTFLQFGRDYQGARDNFVYLYAPELNSISSELSVQNPGEITLMRVPKGEITNESAYEFFSGMSGGNPTWSGNIQNRQPVFQDSNGVGWTVSVSYNAPLNRYFLITEHQETSTSRIGIFDAPTPWGPWTTVLYERWSVPNTGSQRHFFWNFSNKWLSADGKNFVLISTGIGQQDRWNSIEGSFVTSQGGGPDTLPPAAPTSFEAAP